MTTPQVRLLSSPDEVAAALVAAAAWSTEFDLCTPAIDSALGRWPVWCALLEHHGRLRRAFVALDGLRSEPHALAELHRIGLLRLVPAADGSFRVNALRFRRGNEVRVLAGGGALVPSGFMAPLDALTLWEGHEAEPYAAHADRLFARAKEAAHIPEPEELEKYAAMFFEGAAHRDALAEIGAPLIRRTAFDGERIDLELVDGARAVQSAIDTVKRQLSSVATISRRQTVGFHGGSVTETVYWSAPLGIWALFKTLENRYWNAFGVEHPDVSRSLQITVEANPPLKGLDRKMGGAIARESQSGKAYLVHRGRLGGGQKGVGSELFWSRFRGGVQMVEPDRPQPSRVVIVGEIGAPSFPRDLAAFVHEVGRIKRAA